MMQETVQVGRQRPLFAYLILVNTDRAGDIVQLQAPETTVGRAAHHHLRLDDPAVSADHARIRCEGAAFTFIDLGSENGARVNGRATRHHVLRHNDSLELGRTRMVFKLVGTEAR